MIFVLTKRNFKGYNQSHDKIYLETGRKIILKSFVNSTGEILKNFWKKLFEWGNP